MKQLSVLFVAGAITALPVSSALAQQSSSPGMSQPGQSTQPPSSSPSQPGQSGAQPSGPQSSGQQAAQGGQQGLHVATDALIGSKVRDSQGKELGEVSKIMIDPQQGKITSLVISMGGTLGVGGKQVSVPWESVKVQRDQQSVVLTMDQKLLEQAPRPERSQERQRDQGSPSASPATGQDQQQNQQRK